jgi:UPF0271 protein
VGQEGITFRDALLFFCTQVARYTRPVRIDLNADAGESLEEDDELFAAVTSINVAAGFHAGDASLLRRTIRRARNQGVAVGAHPGFPDRSGFGRREMSLTASEVEDLVLYQVAAVAGVAAVEGLRLQHVKPHGALYNMAARDPGLAAAVAGAVCAFDRQLVLVGPPGSALLGAGRAAGLVVAAEAFADRAYSPDGSLVPRTSPGALIRDPALAVPRVLRMLRDQTVLAIDGTVLAIHADTICIHGDTPGAAALARAAREAIERAGIRCAALSG